MPFVYIKNHIGNIFLVFLSVATTIFAVELMLRFYYEPDIVMGYRAPHPVLGWVLEPNKAYQNLLKEATVSVSYNSKGFRDVEHVEENTDKMFRILVLGDSFMEAYSVELNESFAKLLESNINKMGRKAEVINLGVGGYGTLQEYLVFHELGKIYKPELVLLGFYLANDVSDNSLEISSLMYTGMMKVDSRPFLEPGSSNEWRVKKGNFEVALSRYESVKEQRDSFLGKMVLIQLVRRMISDKKGVYKKSNMLAQYGVSYCSEPIEYTRAWETTKRILAQLKLEVEVMGGKLVVFSVPALQDTSPQYMERVLDSVAHPERICFEDAPGYEKLNTILTELEIDFVDLLPDFRRHDDEGVTLFRQSDRHWNPAGHNLAAKNVSEALKKKKCF